MSPKKLRRCTLCGKFHASYLVYDLPTADGKGYLCYACWTARQCPGMEKEEAAPEKSKAQPKVKP